MSLRTTAKGSLRESEPATCDQESEPVTGKASLRPAKEVCNKSVEVCKCERKSASVIVKSEVGEAVGSDSYHDPCQAELQGVDS